MRDIQDYRIHSEAQKTIITGGSAFNIKAKSLRLDDFGPREVNTLLLEHTDETSQSFTPEALDLVWSLTSGQPWLVNARPTLPASSSAPAATAPSRSQPR
ncbi:hypothetical protein [Candidatus Amarolinea dominans]|uniref:hypothetical protein n=1 Tax=Candidatus Amarolinea dominans TaxID=3140696 RepID=UPI0031CC84D8